MTLGLYYRLMTISTFITLGWQIALAAINEQSGAALLNYEFTNWIEFTFLKAKTKHIHGNYLIKKAGYEVFSSYAMMGIGDRGTPYVITCTGYTGPAVDETRLVFERGILQCNLVENGIQPFGLYYGSNETKDFEKVPITLSNDQMYVREFQAAVDYLSGKMKVPPVPLEWAAEMVRLVESGRH